MLRFFYLITFTKMKSLEKNIEYQILTLRIKLIEINQNEQDFIKKMDMKND